MATFIQTDELTGTQIPTGASGIMNKSNWGIDATLSGCIIQSVSINGQRITDATQDQKGALVSELDYDEQFDLTIDIIGPSSEDGTITNIAVGDTSFEFAGKKWKVRGVSYTGSFQDKKRYQITAFRSANFPAQ